MGEPSVPEWQMPTLREQLASVTRERDEAVAKLAVTQDAYNVTAASHKRTRDQRDAAMGERDALREAAEMALECLNRKGEDSLCSVCRVRLRAALSPTESEGRQEDG